MMEPAYFDQAITQTDLKKVLARSEVKFRSVSRSRVRSGLKREAHKSTLTNVDTK